MFSDMPRPNGGESGGAKKYIVGDLTSSTTMTFDVSNIIPNYQSITKDNFYFDITGGSIVYGAGATSTTVTKSYNASTGVLTVSVSYAKWTIKGTVFAFV